MGIELKIERIRVLRRWSGVYSLKRELPAYEGRKKIESKEVGGATAQKI
jgi:hypothetical protein